MILSRQNRIVKETVALKDKKARRGRGEYLIEGEKAVAEAVRCGLDISLILGEPSLVQGYAEKGYTVFETSREIADHCADSVTPQGVVAVIKARKKPIEKPRGISVVLDGVKDPGNVGTVIRTCAALGVKDIYLVDCADAYSPKCVRSSMCGIFHVDISEISYEEADALFDNCALYVADMGGENVFEVEKSEDFCLVIGSESHGVSEFFRSRAKKTLAIPMSENMESLNAAISCSIILYHLIKKPI